MAGLNIVARYECVYNRNSKNFKDKHKKSNSWEKVGEKFNLSCLFMNIFRTNNQQPTKEKGRNELQVVEENLGGSKGVGIKKWPTHCRRNCTQFARSYSIFVHL